MEATIRFQGEEHRLTHDDILKAAKQEPPEQITTYYVEIDGRRFSPKQLIRIATGTRKPFNSANARSLLTRLGFHVKALPAESKKQ